MTFKRTRQQPGVWPFKCKVLARCNKLRQQGCGCEGEGMAEKAALVYYFAETGQPGNSLVWLFILVICSKIVPLWVNKTSFSFFVFQYELKK